MSMAIKAMCVAAVLHILLLAGSGCAVVDKSRMRDERTDYMPWNTRAPWEDQVIGIPY